MISIVMVDAVELVGGFMISSLPPMCSKPSAKSSFMIGMLITVVPLLKLDFEISLDICS